MTSFTYWIQYLSLTTSRKHPFSINSLIHTHCQPQPMVHPPAIQVVTDQSNKKYKASKIITIILVEDPNEEFQHLRDYVDACLCGSLQSFSPEQLMRGFSPDMASEACAKFKINKVCCNNYHLSIELCDFVSTCNMIC